jgi:hypothetical protein
MPDGALGHLRSNLGGLVVTRLLRRVRAPPDACTAFVAPAASPGASSFAVTSTWPPGVSLAADGSAAELHLDCAAATTPSRASHSRKAPLKLELELLRFESPA